MTAFQVPMLLLAQDLIGSTVFLQDEKDLPLGTVTDVYDGTGTPKHTHAAYVTIICNLINHSHQNSLFKSQQLKDCQFPLMNMLFVTPLLLQVLEHMTCYAFQFRQNTALPKSCLLVVSRYCSLLPKSLCQLWMMNTIAFSFLPQQAYWSWPLLPRQKIKRLLAAKSKNPAGKTRLADYDDQHHASLSWASFKLMGLTTFLLLCFLLLCFPFCLAADNLGVCQLHSSELIMKWL